jgi:hypothetical protein
VLELSRSTTSVVDCLAAPEACDRVAPTGGATACRIAPDEILLVSEPGAEAALLGVAAAATASDPDALVVEVTDGWAVWTLAGEETREVFARLSAIPLPVEGFTQGEVAHVPVKVLSLPDRLHLLVPSMWGDYLRERILAECTDLGVHESAEAAPWARPAGKRRGR